MPDSFHDMLGGLRQLTAQSKDSWKVTWQICDRESTLADVRCTLENDVFYRLSRPLYFNIFACTYQTGLLHRTLLPLHEF